MLIEQRVIEAKTLQTMTAVLAGRKAAADAPTIGDTIHG